MMRMSIESGSAISCSSALGMACAASVHYAKWSGGLPGTESAMRSQNSKAFWLQKIVQLLKANTVLDTIKLPKHFLTRAATEKIQCYQEEIVARVEMNRYRIRIDAIKNVPGTALRAKLLGRELALPSVRYRPNQTFMLISENIELVASYLCSRKRKRHRADVYD
jgi:hypothetical protein